MRATRVVLFKAEEPRSETHRGSREVANGLTPTRTVRTRCLRHRGAAQSANASAHEQIFRAINGQSEAARRSAFRPANSERQVPLRVDGCRPPRPCRRQRPDCGCPHCNGDPWSRGCTSSARHCSGSSTWPTDPGRPGWFHAATITSSALCSWWFDLHLFGR